MFLTNHVFNELLGHADDLHIGILLNEKAGGYENFEIEV